MKKKTLKAFVSTFKIIGIARRLVIATIIFGFFITLATTSYQLYADYRQDLKTIHGYFTLIQKSYLSSLSRSVWMFDGKQIDAELDGLSKLPGMEALEIQAGQGYRWSSGAVRSKRTIIERFPLTFRHRDRTFSIGTLIATAGLDNVYHRLIDKTLTILATNAIRAFFVSGFILLIFQYLVTRHLVDLADTVARIDFSGTPERIALKRKKQRSHRDEIDQVVLALNQMQTDLFKSYEALKNSEDELYRIFSMSIDLICIVDINTATFVKVNPAFSETLGYSSEELTSKPFLEFIHPDDVQTTSRMIDAKLKAGRKVIDYENRYRCKNGSYRWLRWVSRPVPEKGLSYAVAHDITGSKHSEQRIEHLNRVLRAIRDVNQLIVREADPGTLIGEVCRLVVDNRGYASALIVLTDEKDRPIAWARAGLAASCASLNNLFERGELLPCCQQVRAKTQAELFVDRTAVCSQCPLGEKCARTQSLCAQLVHDGAAFGYYIAALDSDHSVDEEEIGLFTEMAADLAYALNVMRAKAARESSERKRKALESQLIQAQKMESVGQLAGGVAHDYNNMLSVIIGYAELALDKLGLDAPLRDDILEILTAARRSSNITGQLLAFARKQTIAPEVLDLNQTVESMLNMLRRLIGEDIDLVWHPRPGVWPVNMDPTQIDQILANLCVNARDAIADVGKITIETDSISIDEAYCAEHAGFVPGDFVILAVSDDGHGMDRETMDKIFEPFFTSKGMGRGTGLGLATVYGIVKQNAGFINVYSEPAKGTTFKIYLPGQADRTVTIEKADSDEAPQGRGETVLVVEDEASILKLANKILTGLGYKVLSAASPAEALKLAEAGSAEISLLITDVVMPEMNGRVLAERLQAVHPKLKCLFMSGYTADVIAHRGVLEDGVSFIQKPFSKKDLAAKVRASLD
jgi:PAS domain S-box-containing protein